MFSDEGTADCGVDDAIQSMAGDAIMLLELPENGQ